MLRYSLLRLLIFLGCVSLLWLVGLRDREELLLLVVVAALLSAVISYFGAAPLPRGLLGPARAEARAAVGGQAGRPSRPSRVDEVDEDAEVSGDEGTFR